jgi:hypothetical protein
MVAEFRPVIYEQPSLEMLLPFGVLLPSVSCERDGLHLTYPGAEANAPCPLLGIRENKTPHIFKGTGD